MFEQSFGRALAAVTLIGALGSTGAVVPTEPQSPPGRQYSHGGLEIDLPGDWQLVSDSEPWYLTFRSATTPGDIVFIVRLPFSDRSYFGSFESFAKRQLRKVKGLRDVKHLKVSGLDAVSFSQLRDAMFRPGLRIEIRETWIGVPDGPTSGTVFRFYTSVEPSGPQREAKLIVYERMLASMRIDPETIHQQ